ncbi:hypothetical protein MTE01_28760 [Microbacterium testaceum]|uniref:Uncharacterized protein n=1 Tax=Microbacterium testaceum TaxID=2033 RepID=A0A4Y3QP69_MICTE|nr:hypothetical protein MTE01_28760 [Microbacterium testaceum]
MLLAEPTPLADPAAPHDVVAYRITAGAPDLAVRAALRDVRTATQTATAGLIDWTPAPLPEPEPEPSETPIFDGVGAAPEEPTAEEA